MAFVRPLGCAIIAVSAAGCAARSSPFTVRPASPLGLPPAAIGQHAFQADLPNGVKLLGTVVVTGDTIVPRPTDGECRLGSGAPNRQHFVYECAIPGTTGIMLAFDRSSPLRRSTWGLSTSVRRTRSLCISWRTWENGTRTCTQSEPQEYFERVQRTGPLLVVPP